MTAVMDLGGYMLPGGLEFMPIKITGA